MGEQSGQDDVVDNKAYLRAHYQRTRKKIAETLAPLGVEDTKREEQHAVSLLTARQFRAESRARRDLLTGLPNRREFMERMQAGLDQLRRSRAKQVVVMLLDLDGFKNVNDTLGHEAGNAVLKEVAVFLSSSIRSYDVASRIGGDEFGVLQLNGEEEFAHQVSQRIQRGLQEKSASVPGLGLIHPSIGVARIGLSDVAIDPEKLLDRADMAMYHAKIIQSGGKVAFWHPGMVKPPGATSR